MRTKTFLITAMLICLFAAANAQHTTPPAGNNKAATFFNGAWQGSENKSFVVIHEGYFNAVGQDSTGKWAAVHAGIITVNNDNTVTFKVLYSSYPDHIGSLNTAEYTVNGETVKMRHFKKLVTAEGKDITDQMPKDAWETLTRMK